MFPNQIGIVVKFTKLPTLLGLVILAVGAVFTQLPEERYTKEIKYRDVLLTHNNSTWTLDLGKISKGSEIRVNYGVSKWLDIIYQVMRSDTKTPLKERFGNTVIRSSQPLGQAAYDKFPVEEEAEYFVTVTIPPEAEERRLSFFYVTILGFSTHRSQIPGVVLVVAGSIIVVLSIVRSRKHF